MPLNLPILRNTTGTLNAQVLYPFVRVASCLTTVTQFQNAAEQRSVERPPLYGFQIPMSSLLAADKRAWLNFHVSAVGRQHTDLALSLGGTTYSNLTLLSDLLDVIQKDAVVYDQTASLRQVAAVNFSTYTPPTPGAFYPNLKFGLASPSQFSSELPFRQSSNFLTSVGDSPYGPRYTFSWYNPGSPLAGFPSTYLRSWVLSYPLLTDVDMATIETQFLGCQGRYKLFNFTDPTSVATLVTGISSGSTSAVVTDASTIQNGGYITIESETLAVSAGGNTPGTSTLTVARGALGTSAASHSAGLKVYCTYPNVRFAEDDLSIHALTVNQNSTEVRLIQTNG